MSSIFDEWRARPHHRGQLFISDGIIDEDRWQRAKVRLLFLLKEAYESDPTATAGWDLCALIRDGWQGPRTNMWWRVAEWAYGLSRVAGTGDVAPYPARTDPELTEALLSAAVVNVKKSGGQSASTQEDLQTYVDADWDLLQRQIGEISPHLVVCGNTFSLLRDRLEGQEKIGEWVYTAEGLSFVDYWHPANQFPSKLNYYSLCTAVRLSGVLGASGGSA